MEPITYGRRFNRRKDCSTLSKDETARAIRQCVLSECCFLAESSVRENDIATFVQRHQRHPWFWMHRKDWTVRQWLALIYTETKNRRT